jgi:hypothetical protein
MARTRRLIGGRKNKTIKRRKGGDMNPKMSKVYNNLSQFYKTTNVSNIHHLCDFIKTLIPNYKTSDAVDPDDKPIVCYMILLIGLYSYYFRRHLFFYDDKYDNSAHKHLYFDTRSRTNNPKHPHFDIVIKGGLAVQLALSEIPGAAVYESDDIDVLIIVYDKNKKDNTHQETLFMTKLMGSFVELATDSLKTEHMEISKLDNTEIAPGHVLKFTIKRHYKKTAILDINYKIPDANFYNNLEIRRFNYHTENGAVLPGEFVYMKLELLIMERVHYLVKYSTPEAIRDHTLTKYNISLWKSLNALLDGCAIKMGNTKQTVLENYLRQYNAFSLGRRPAGAKSNEELIAYIMSPTYNKLRASDSRSREPTVHVEPIAQSTSRPHEPSSSRSQKKPKRNGSRSNKSNI